MNDAIQPGGLACFSVPAAGRSLRAAARELGVTTAAVSKRLAQLEARLGVALVNRTTRRMSLTPEGAICQEHARRMLDEIDELQRRLGRARDTPSGLLRVHATPGFGRSHVAPAVSNFVRRYPQAEVRLTLAADPPSFDDDAFDVFVRFGTPPTRHADARRVGCRAPSGERRAGAGAAELPHARGRHPRGLRAAASEVAARECFCRSAGESHKSASGDR